MYRLFVLVIMILFSFKVKAQIHYIEKMPSPPYNVYEFISSVIFYPDDAYEKNIEGRVVVKFIVDTNGSLTQPVIIQSLYPSCDSEVLRVVTLMPKWNPGFYNNKPVRVYYTLPVTFKTGKQADQTRKN